MNLLAFHFPKIFVVKIFFLSACVISFSQNDLIPTATADLSNPDRNVRYRAVYILASAKDDERSIDPLIRALDDTDDEIREMATHSLGFRKEKRAVGGLIRLLKDKKISIQATAARGLGEIGDDSAVLPLIEALNEPETNLQYPVIGALAKFNDPRAVVPLFSQIGRGPFASEIPKAIGSSGVEPMIEIVKNGSATDRENAVWVLSQIADERALDTLISVLATQKDSIAYNAVNAIAYRVGAAAIEPLQNAFKSGDLELKKKILITLAKIDDQRVLGALEIIIRDSDVTVRRMLVEILGESSNYSYGPESDHVISAILTAANDKDPDIRNLAIRAFSNVQREDVDRALVNALSDPETSSEASLILGVRKDLRSIPYLLITLKGDNPRLAVRAQHVLQMIGEPAVDGLISVLRDKNKEFPLRDIRRQKEQDEDSKVFRIRCGNEPPPPPSLGDPRVLAAYTLGEIGDKRAIEYLTEALKDKSPWLREASATALDKLRKMSPALE